MRYLARRLSLVPSDPAEAARVDAVFETSQDLFLPLNPTVNFAVGEAFEVSKGHSDSARSDSMILNGFWKVMAHPFSSAKRLLLRFRRLPSDRPGPFPG